jgi:hypothetical protein
MSKASVNLGGWLDHWSRVGRWHARLQDMCRGIPFGRSPHEAVDDVLAFYVFCYHLCDALVREGHDEAKIEAYIRGSKALALCRDLATAVKHLEVRKPYVPTQHLMTAAIQTVLLSGKSQPCEPLPGERWVVRTDSGDKDLFELADECIEAWRAYLESVVAPRTSPS